VFNRDQDTASPTPSNFRLDTLWEYQAAPSEYRIIRRVFRAFRFTDADALRYMRSRPTSIRVSAEGRPRDYFTRVAEIARDYVAFLRDAVNRKCPSLKACYARTQAFEKPVQLPRRGKPPRNAKELDAYVASRRSELQAIPDRGDNEVINELITFWINPSSDAPWEQC